MIDVHMIQGIEDDTFSEYLKDESRFMGKAKSIFFPENEEEMTSGIFDLWSKKTMITVQGTRTGIVGAAVPIAEGSCIVNCEKMDKILGMDERDGTFYLTIQPGVRLESLNKSLETGSFDFLKETQLTLEAYKKFCEAESQVFLPNPTEKTATLAGIFSSNASGMNSHCCGQTSKFFESITVIIPPNIKWTIRRGEYIFGENGCSLPDGRIIPIDGIACEFVKPLLPCVGMDLIDLFSGSEGMLGAIERLKLRLVDAPKNNYGIMCFFSKKEDAICFSKKMLGFKESPVYISALEFFDERALSHVERFKSMVSKLKNLPDIPDQTEAAVYVELISDQADDMDEALLLLLDWIDEFGGNEDKTWAASDKTGIEQFHLFRHAVPESVNNQLEKYRRTDKRIHKTAADFRVESAHFAEIMDMYYNDVEKGELEGVIFGHIFDTHLHVNIVPKTFEEMIRAQEIIGLWAKKILEFGGSVIAENGVGKIKKELYREELNKAQYEAVSRVKAFFDPDGLLNPGNML